MLRARAHDCAHADVAAPARAASPRSPLHDGDLVVVHEKYTSLTAVTLHCNKHLDNRYGRFRHDHPLRNGYGTRWSAVSRDTRRCAGFVHVLRPNAALMAYAMLHRTQIVYPHDAFVVSAFLALKPGSVVVECGTGSGSAAAAFATAVAPNGRVLSFEFHRARAQAADQHFQRLGIAHIVRVTPGVDVVEQGFVGVDDASADAVFLDVPAPYALITHAKRVLKNNGVLCAFSPCVEQVGRTCEQLRRTGFYAVRTLTAPVKTFETRRRAEGAPRFAAEPSSVGAKPSSVGAKRTRCEQRASSIGTRVAKRRRAADGSAAQRVAAREDGRRGSAGAERVAVAALNEQRHVGRVLRAAAPLHSRPFSVMKGHTSFLTFATRGGADAARATREAAQGELAPRRARQQPPRCLVM